MTIATSARRWIDVLGAGSAWRIVVPLTVAYVLAYLVATVLVTLQLPLVQAGLVAAAGAVLLSKRAASTVWPWLAMSALMIAALVPNWMMVDNHVFLATYWLIALSVLCSAPLEKRPRAMELAASTLLGLTMLFATVHKLRAPEFLSGDFFHLTFLTEARFAPIGWLVGQDLGQIAAINGERIAALKSDPSQGPVALMTGAPSLRDVALAFSWIVFVFELVLAALWLVRADNPLGRRLRHGALLTFAIGTYTIAPVPGFGGILMILGLADTREGEGALRAAYLAVLLHVLFGAAILRALLP